MAAPKTRKKAPVPKPRSRRAPATSSSCSACGGKKGLHNAKCPNFACPTCGMRGGNHKIDCANHPNATNDNKAAKEPVLDGKTGGVIHTDVDGQPAKVDARTADLGLSVDTESLLMELAKKQRIVTQLSSERGRVSNKLKEAKESLDHTVATLAQRGIDLTEPKLPGVESVAGAEATDDEDEDEIEDEATS